MLADVLKDFASYDDQNILKALVVIFLENSHLFFQADPSGCIELLNTFFNNNIEINENVMENVIRKKLVIQEKLHNFLKILNHSNFLEKFLGLKAKLEIILLKLMIIAMSWL